MKLFYALIILIIFQSCSFDNKSGIWKNDNILTKDENTLLGEFETLSSTQVSFKEIIPYNTNSIINLPNPITNKAWLDVFYNSNNNFNNFNYKDLNKLFYKSKKITRFKINNFILYKDNNVFLSDHNGNIIIFSIIENKIIYKYNFYKKKYKKINKELNYVLDDNILYISDNIGYLYALDFIENKILWAKNYKVPFRSNLKLSQDKLIAANQNNNLYFFNKKTGDILTMIPTEETPIKNQFINSLSVNNQESFFLNTYGSIYSINNDTLKINWFLNLNQSIDINPSSLFKSNQIISQKDVIIVATNNFTYILDSATGIINHKKNFSSAIKPLLIEDHLFLVTPNNYLICMNINNGKII